ncbi:uncharacterized protein LOC143475567 isoform X2 [Brachyhypopomus gauderio]|uniref:uncharacterized protein LOC143475567 isoform X2 n=1 Tax=Brachyhypopomus gauderio TaxID=698409 RepID=UPI004041DA8B
MIRFYVISFFLITLGNTSEINIIQMNGPKFVKIGEDILLNCSFSSNLAFTTAWFKHSLGEKPLLIASAYHSSPVVYHNHFNETGRHNAVKKENNFNLSISKAEPSDSATYYCAVSYYEHIGLEDCTVLVLKDEPAIHYDVIQHPVLKPVKTGGNETLQCTVLTERCAGEHSVYWIKDHLDESQPGIIYTYGNSSGQCKKSSETGSPTQSCVYELPKKNLSSSDSGTYYCAVAACGQILFGSRTKLNLAEKGSMDPAIFILAASTTICLLVVLLLCRRLHKSHREDVAEGQTVQVKKTEDPGTLNYAALSFAQPPSSKGTTAKFKRDQSVYAQTSFPA